MYLLQFYLELKHSSVLIDVINVLQYKSTSRCRLHLKPLPKSVQYEAILKEANNRTERQIQDGNTAG